MHTSWTTENGLPQNSITSILQTRDGYLWIGTFGGLARFDGVRFIIFDAGNTPALKSSRILYLHEDRAGGLWIGTVNGGVSRYFQGRFTTWTEKDGLPSDSLRDYAIISDDSRGNAWTQLLPLGEQELERLAMMAARPQTERGKLLARLQTNGHRYWTEIEVQDDPRAAKQNLLFVRCDGNL